MILLTRMQYSSCDVACTVMQYLGQAALLTIAGIKNAFRLCTVSIIEAFGFRVGIVSKAICMVKCMF